MACFVVWPRVDGFMACFVVWPKVGGLMACFVVWPKVNGFMVCFVVWPGVTSVLPPYHSPIWCFVVYVFGYALLLEEVECFVMCACLSKCVNA